MTDPKCSQKAPYVMEMEAGTYAWCACGRTKKQPFCDGSHSGTDIRPVIEKLDEKATVAWCGCRKSKRGHRCDGSHSRA